MLSDRGIKEAIRKKLLVIDPFSGEIDSCTYDLTTERLYRLKSGVSFQDIPEPDEMEKFLGNHCEPCNGMLLNNYSYIGVSQEKVLSFLDYTETTTRSSAARLGIEVNNVYPFDRGKYFHEMGLKPRPVYFGLMTYVPIVKVPEGVKLVQLSADLSIFTQGQPFYELFGRIQSDPKLTLLSKTDMKRPLRDPLGSVSDAAVLHIGDTVKVHNGNMLVWGENNDRCFSEVDVTIPYILSTRQFCIIPSEEYLTMPNTHAGILWDTRHQDDKRDYIIHPNAPIIKPGSAGNQIFEVWHDFETTIKAGDEISVLTFHKLDQEPENAYRGKYMGQRGPQTSLSQLDVA